MTATVFRIRVTFWGSRIEVEVVPETTIQYIRQALQYSEGIPSHNLCLLFKGVRLDDDDKTLAEYGVKDGDVLTGIVCNLLSGPQPRSRIRI